MTSLVPGSSPSSLVPGTSSTGNDDDSTINAIDTQGDADIRRSFLIENRSHDMDQNNAISHQNDIEPTVGGGSFDRISQVLAARNARESSDRQVSNTRAENDETAEVKTPPTPPNASDRYDAAITLNMLGSYEFYNVCTLREVGFYELEKDTSCKMARSKESLHLSMPCGGVCHRLREQLTQQEELDLDANEQALRMSQVCTSLQTNHNHNHRTSIYPPYCVHSTYTKYNL